MGPFWKKLHQNLRLTLPDSMCPTFFHLFTTSAKMKSLVITGFDVDASPFALRSPHGKNEITFIQLSLPFVVKVHQRSKMERKPHVQSWSQTTKLTFVCHESCFKRPFCPQCHILKIQGSSAQTAVENVSKKQQLQNSNHKLSQQ